MKKFSFLIILVLTFVLEITVCFVSIGKLSDIKQDTVAVNSCLHSVEDNLKINPNLDYETFVAENSGFLDFVISFLSLLLQLNSVFNT